jgi:hypothetical protein
MRRQRGDASNCNGASDKVPITAAWRARRLGQVNSAGCDVAEYNL